MLHLFGSLTYELPSQTRFTGLSRSIKFIRTLLLWEGLRGSNSTLVTVDVVPYGAFTFNYTGGLGAGLGFDTPLTGNKNVRFVAEAWSHDLTEPTAFALLGALRLESQNFLFRFRIYVFYASIACAGSRILCLETLNDYAI